MRTKRLACLAWVGIALSIMMPVRFAHGIGAVCNPSGSVAERAQCLIESAEQTGVGNPDQWQPSQVPGFVTSTPPESELFDTSGHPTALDQAAAQASQSEQANTLRNQYNQAAGWNLADSPPVQTAGQVAQQPASDPHLSQTCQTTTTCVSWQQTPSGGGICQAPGVQQETCLIVEAPSAVSATYTASGSYSHSWTAGDIIGWCVTLQWESSGVVAVDIGANTCPTSGLRTRFIANQPPVTGQPYQLTEQMTITVTNNCAGSRTWTLSPGVPTNGGWSGACSGGFVSFQFSWAYHRAGYDVSSAVSDGCAQLVHSAQQGTAAMQATQCLAPGDTVVTASDGSQLTVPITFSSRGCWREQQTWIRSSDVQDTCQSYRDQGCAQTNSVCGQQDSVGNCMWYENTYTCTTPTCTSQQTVRICATCGDPNGLVPFCLDDATPPDQSLMQTAAWLQVLRDARDQWDPNTLTIFRGERLQCVHGSGFGNITIDNCCADPPSGDCSQMEWDAYAARRARRAHYIGEYCSNRINLLLGSVCVERTMVWCAFPSSFARIIHEQGRPALPRDWGTPEAPDCGPLTIQEFERLPLNAMDFSEVYDQLVITNDTQAISSQAAQSASQATGR